MRKATAIYHAPDGDSEVVHMGGVRFFDGQEVELNSDEHAHLLNKLPGNRYFEIEIGEDDIPADKPKRGRPPKVVEPVIIGSMPPPENLDGLT